MKRFVCVVCIVALLLPGCSGQKQDLPQPEYTQCIYELTFDAKQLSNNSVGKDWSFTYTRDCEVIKSGHQIILLCGETVLETIEVEIREKDKLDDVDIGVIEVAVYDGYCQLRFYNNEASSLGQACNN